MSKFERLALPNRASSSLSWRRSGGLYVYYVVTKMSPNERMCWVKCKRCAGLQVGVIRHPYLEKRGYGSRRERGRERGRDR